ncbi:TPA: adenylyltransferase/cytidyltransferase family protein [Escherichia coli]
MGHVNILKRAKEFGDLLIVGVSSDSLNFSKKQRYPIYSQEERIEIISSLKFVDHVFIEESLDLKLEYIRKYEANLLVMGDDWKGRFDWVKDECEVIYLPRTPSISTTEIIEIVRRIK